MTKVDLFHNLRVKFNELSLREHLIVEETTKELEQENNKLLDVINNQDVKIADLEKQIEKMRCCENCKGVCNSDDVAYFCKNNNYKLWELKE